MGVPAADPSARKTDRSGLVPLKLLVGGVAALGMLALAGTLALQNTAMDKQSGRSASPAVRAPQIAAPIAEAAKVIPHTVLYELTGDGGARNITYVAQGADIAQERVVATPWSKSVQRHSAEGGVDYYSLSAQNAGGGRIGCRITVDGEVVNKNSTSGSGAVVMCSVSVR
jgi:hypothetical protein